MIFLSFLVVIPSVFRDGKTKTKTFFMFSFNIY